MYNNSADFPEVSVRPSMLNQANKILLGMAIVGAGIPIARIILRHTLGYSVLV